MTKDKKLLIAVISMGAVGFACLFLLGFITDFFVLFGMYCVISSTLWCYVWSAVKAGKRPKLTLVGIAMALIGLLLLNTSEEVTAFGRPLSSVYVAVGLSVLTKGIKDLWDVKNNCYPDDCPSRYIGIGLFLSGLALSITLIKGFPLLLGLAHIMVAAGFVVTVRSFFTKKKKVVRKPKQEIKRTSDPIPVFEQNKNVCARCKKMLPDIDAVEKHGSFGNRYCDSCKKTIEKEMENTDMHCNSCGAVVLGNDLCVYDGELLCTACLKKKSENVVS